MNFYQEFGVGKELEPFVECFWLLYVDEGISGVSKILPDSSSELIFTRYAVSRKNNINSKLLFSGKSHLTTLKLNEQNIKLGPRVEFIGARLKAHATSCFWNLRDTTEIDQVIDARNLFPRQFINRIELLESKLPYGIRLSILHDLLTSQLKISNEFSFQKLTQAIQAIEATRGNIKVNELSFNLNCSSKTIGRYFIKYVGVTPKVYARLYRFRCFLIYHLNHREISMNQCAMKFGYYDENHLYKEIETLLSKESQQLLKGYSQKKFNLQNYLLQNNKAAIAN